jgi:hypothetical protein
MDWAVTFQMGRRPMVGFTVAACLMQQLMISMSKVSWQLSSGSSDQRVHQVRTVLV